jgi:hypothetical protein
VLAFGRDELAGVRRAVEELCGFEARFSHFPLAGLCPGCSAQA